MTGTLRWTDLVAIGRVAKPQGRFGEVAIQPFSDLPDRFPALGRVFFLATDGTPSSLSVESARLHKGRPVLKLEGVSDIGEAEALCGREVRVPEEELEPLPEDAYYHFQLVGLSIVDREKGRVGVVEDVIPTGGTDVLVVRREAGGEALVPLCREICRRIDPSGGRIEVDAPDGLLDINEAREAHEERGA